MASTQIINCPVCAARSTISFRKKEYKFYKCSECSLVFLDQNYIPKNSQSQYLRDETSPSRYYELVEKYDQESFRKRLGVIEKYITVGTLLDIGASTGNFLKTALKRGWKATGIEPNPQSVKSARKFSGSKVINGFFNATFVKQHKTKYDLVYSSDVIEHMEDPLQFIKLEKKVIKDSGLIVTVTPDFDHLFTRLFQIKPQEHYIYFNKKSLVNLHKKAGLEILLLQNIHRERSIQAMLSSTTFENRPLWRGLILFINFLSLHLIIEFVIQLFKEDIITISRLKVSSQT